MKLHLPGVGVILAQAGIPRYDAEQGDPGIRLRPHGDAVVAEAIGYPLKGDATIALLDALTVLRDAGLLVETSNGTLRVLR